jgi:catechol 2,3-dioxygenase-like lactoylglutathione lyase family enzyme
MRLDQTIPAMPVRDMSEAVDFYRHRLGFSVRHHADDYGVLARDDAEIHLWAASDETWRERNDLRERPLCSGAESFLAGSASCRIRVDDVSALYDECRQAGVLHQVSVDGVADTDYGTQEFSTLDQDGNLVSFFRWVSR